MALSLPAFNALMNTTSAVCVVAGWTLIRRGRRDAHRTAMLLALFASALFLGGYVTHHLQVGSVPFRGQGLVRVLYFAILGPHTLGAMAALPMVLVTATLAGLGRFEAHRRLARLTLPLWLFVSVTGVVVYFMLYHGPGTP
jgi:putative membrane protein